MDPLSITASIISILQLSGKVLGYLNEVQDASKDRARCAIEAANLNSLLTALRFCLDEGDFSAPWFTAVQALGVQDGPLDQFKQALGQLQSAMTSGGSKMRRVSEALVWKFKKEEIASIMARMGRLKTLVGVALQMDHLKLSKAIKDDTCFIRETIPTIQSDLHTLRGDQERAQNNQLISWISPTDFPAQQSDFINRRQEGTGQWFLDTPEFSKWSNEQSSTLFCPGIPGAGKTMVAAIAIDDLLTSVPQNSIGVAFVYCNYKAQSEQDTINLLAAILKQLVQARPLVAKHVQQLHKKHTNRGTKPSMDEVFVALQFVLTEFSTVHIVIDALDECADGTRHQFLAKLQTLQTGTDLRLLVTSRFIPDIVDKFKEALKVEVRASDKDVRRLFAGQIHRLPRCVQRDPALQDIVQDKIIEAVEGMFLLARLHIDSLQDKRTKSKIHFMLDTLSKGSEALEEAYKDAIERIQGQLPGDAELAMKVLSWITYAQRPLTTEEIRHALAVERDKSEIDLDDLLDIEDIVSVCAGLVTVDEKSHIIRLVHYTTQEYFERIREQWNPSAQVECVLTCLTYLSMTTFTTGACSNDRDFEVRLKQNPFLRYAAEHWGHHPGADEEEVHELACSFLLQDSLISCALQAILVQKWGIPEYSQNYPKRTTGLHITARFGLHHLFEELFQSLKKDARASIDMENSKGETALYLAAMKGHISMVKLLLDKGANVNPQSLQSSDALEAASYHGYKEIVELLLDKGANVNGLSGSSLRTLWAASLRGHEEIVELLLDKGANVNAQDEYSGMAPLYTACFEGHRQVVKLLIGKGANVHAQVGKFGNALQAASWKGNKQIIELLVNNGADVNAQGGGYGNALQAASLKGHERIVELLLENGADVNAQGGHYGIALQAASYGGYEQIVKLLLNHVANVNAQGGTYGNALQAASFKGHEQIVKLLLDKGANVNAQGGKYGNALQAASFEGHERIVELLLNHVANVNSQGGTYGNALQAASFKGHEQIVKLLLDKGANVNAQGGAYENAFDAACQADRVEVMKLLLEAGFNPNTPNYHYGSYLNFLAFRGYTDLLRLGSEGYIETPLILEPHGRTPLQFAARGGHLNTCRYLLHLGIDPITTDAKGENLLNYTSSGGSLDVLNAVLDTSYIFSTQNEHWSPLHWACRTGNTDLVERLLTEGFRSDCVTLAQPQGQWSPISIAIFHGNEKMLEELSKSSVSLLGTREDAIRLQGIRCGAYWCSSCFHSIYGTRFHCLTCPDLDYCFMCKPFLSHLHENHNWDCVEPLIED